MDYQEHLPKRGFYQEPVEQERETETKEIDWEQRRYEIAKDVFCVQEAQFLDANQKMAEVAVRAADALIEELKKTSK